jgi:hypothetical protein
MAVCAESPSGRLRPAEQEDVSSTSNIGDQTTVSRRRHIRALDRTAEQCTSRSGAWIALDELFCRQPDVFRDLAEQCRRDLAPGVEGNRRAPTVRVTKLLVRASLPQFLEARLSRRATTSRGLRVGSVPTYATLMVCTATNSDSNVGSPSSSSMRTTSCRLANSDPTLLNTTIYDNSGLVGALGNTGNC